MLSNERRGKSLEKKSERCLNGIAFFNDIRLILDEQLMGHEKRKIKIALFVEGEGETIKDLLSEYLNAPEISVFELSQFEANPSFIQTTLKTYAPDFVLLLPSVEGFKECFYKTGHGPDFSSIWEALKALNVRVIQANYPRPLEKLSEMQKAVETLNQKMNQQGFILADVERLSSEIGKNHWFDTRLWHLSRTPASLDALEHLARYFSQLINVSMGKIIKLVILDLDQVLWPEILDEVGKENILKDPSSSLFIEFQSYLKELKHSGMMLALCSKNERGEVLEILNSHSHLVLREKDFHALEVSWAAKDLMISNILNKLHVSPEHCLFIDDSAFERELVKKSFPEMQILDTSLDPLENIRMISQDNLFERGALTVEDSLRKDYQPLRESSPAYLKSLNMKLKISWATPADRPRVLQLHQRSNQFNMMTSREATQYKGMTAVVRYEDIYGDGGIISVLHLEKQADILLIQDWLMSCRVFSRGVEERILGWLMSFAQKNGLSLLQGQMIKSERNLIAQRFYPEHGFKLTSTDKNVEIWSSDIQQIVDNDDFSVTDETDHE